MKEISQVKKPGNMKMEGPDCALAWCVALAACFINFVTAGIGRMSGILYVAFIDIFGISRGLATTPFSIRSSIRNLLGPVIGILAQHYGIRTVIIVGGIIGLLSSASCYFATDINWIIIVWGGINGISVACTSTLPQVVIGQYFKKHITTAAGLAISGACVGSFIFPALIEYVLNQYGLQGTFLIIAGISMHVLPAAMLMKKPPWLKQNFNKPTTTIKSTSKLPSKDKDGKNAHTKLPKTSTTQSNLVLHDSIEESTGSTRVSAQFNYFKDDRQTFPGVLFEAVKFLKCNSKYSENINNQYTASIEYSASHRELVLAFLDKMYHIALEKYDYEKRKSFDKSIRNITSSKELINDAQKTIEEFRKESVLKDFVIHLEAATSNFVKSQTIPRILTSLFELVEVHELYEKALLKIKSNTVVEISSKLDNQNDSYYQKDEDIEKSSEAPARKQGFRHYIKTAIKLNSDPIFSLICICRAIHFITFNPVVTAVVDFGMDKGFPEEYGKYIIAALSGGDLIGRLCVGWITDRGYISLPRYMTITMIIQGATTISLPFMDAKWSILTMICMFGFLEGSLYVRHPVLISKYIKREDQSIAMGCLNFLTGLIGFGVPAYIGYFRDTLGSYDRMFYLTGGMGIIAGLVWIFEPYFVRCNSYQREVQEEATSCDK